MQNTRVFFVALFVATFFAGCDSSQSRVEVIDIEECLDGPDLDRDGLGDACDEDDDEDFVCDEGECSYYYDPRFWTDGPDNCPRLYNPEQKDQDTDGIGDACDNDIDGDGVLNDEDNCPRHYTLVRWHQTDRDGDGVGDICDNCPYVPNTDQLEDGEFPVGIACRTDFDGDGLYNECDTCPLVADPFNLDSDQDGWGDVCDPCPYDASDRCQDFG